jgi:hypothetical protein
MGLDLSKCLKSGVPSSSCLRATIIKQEIPSHVNFRELGF